ncbi:hypothetical protein ACHAXT_008510 [Thalassiosira profunda]
MAASLGPSWSLRAPASPRCLSAGAFGGGAAGASTHSNLFDDDAHTRQSPHRQRRRGQQHQQHEEGGVEGNAHFAVAFGTERGSLHYRQYAPLSELQSVGGGAGRAGYGREGSNDPGQLSIDPESTAEGQIDLQGAVKGSIVGVVRASPAASGAASSGATAPVFLLLVDDNKAQSGNPAAQSSAPGAFAAHLVTVKHGAFHKLPPAPAEGGNAREDQPPPGGRHRRGGSHGGRSGGGGGWFGEHGTPRADAKILGGAPGGGNAAQSQSLGALPRMSCAAHHPEAGYVFASGRGVYGLPSTAARAVLAGMAAPSGDERRGGDAFHSTRQKYPGGKSAMPPPPTAVYRNCARSLPPPGVRGAPPAGGGSNGSALALACRGRAAVVAVGSAFYGVPCCLDVGALKRRCGGSASGQMPHAVHGEADAAAALPPATATKLTTFAPSALVHPSVAVEVASPPNPPPSNAADALARQLRPISSLLLLASGRECAVVAVTSVPDPNAVGAISKGGSVPGGTVATTVRAMPPADDGATLPSPILAAAAVPPALPFENSGGGGGDLTSGPLVALLTADGLVHLRSPACLAVPLSQVEVGSRPNDFFALVALPSLSPDGGARSARSERSVVAASSSGAARALLLRPESSQDFADRLIKLCIDAFGPDGFPRKEAAEALGATFAAASYTGNREASVGKRGLLRRYLEGVLGLADDGLGTRGGRASFDGGKVGRAVVVSDAEEGGLEVQAGDADNATEAPSSEEAPASSALGGNALLTGTALHCLACSQLRPPKGGAAARAARACASRLGVVRPGDRRGAAAAASSAGELVADRLLGEAATAGGMEFVESAVWLLRSCGRHARALGALHDRMADPAFRNASAAGARSRGSASAPWSQLKFDSHLAAHLGELWGSRDDSCRALVLASPSTKDLLARNPTLGLSVFTAAHPRNAAEWQAVRPGEDPLAHPLWPSRVVALLKGVTPQEPLESGEGGAGQRDPGPAGSFSPRSGKAAGPLPVDSGRALAVSYLESALGIATGRPAETPSEGSSASASLHAHPPPPDEAAARAADMHDELAYLLLEAVVSERGDGPPSAEDSELGALYRFKLRRLLAWPPARLRSDRLLGSLPSSFLRERALVLGRMGRHEDALRILYGQEGGLDLALEYCDVRHERQEAEEDCAYLPLVKVALAADPDPDRGTAAAIQVLALRRDAVDQAAALRLLPKDVPVASVVRPFLIPAVVEGASRARRLEVAAALLRSKHRTLQRRLTAARLQSQSTLRGALALGGWDVGDVLHSSRPTKARPVHAAAPHCPDVTLVKHFFARHLVIQAEVRNDAGAGAAAGAEGRALADVAFVVAESSDEALAPLSGVPLTTVPPGAAGSAWCILAASPNRLDGSAFLACELRFTVMDVDAATGTPLGFGDGADASRAGFGRTYVEELQDMEVRGSEFG